MAIVIHMNIFTEICIQPRTNSHYFLFLSASDDDHTFATSTSLLLYVAGQTV